MKTIKTAGTSIEISLSRFCGPDDIVTPISIKDEAIRKELGVYPQNYNNYSRFLRIDEYKAKDFYALLRQLKRPKVTTNFYNHISAKQIKYAIGSKVWNSYYKFCFVRNPWDRAISNYFWEKDKNGISSSFGEWLFSQNPNWNWYIYTISNRVAVDFIGRYEDLDKDLAEVCKKINIPYDNWLPSAKGNIRKDRSHYSQFLTPDQAKYIEERCKDEIKLFGYSFTNQ